MTFLTSLSSPASPGSCHFCGRATRSSPGMSRLAHIDSRQRLMSGREQLMDLNSWESASTDPIRRKRLMAGYTIGAIAVAGFATFITLTASGIVELEPEEEI